MQGCRLPPVFAKPLRWQHDAYTRNGVQVRLTDEGPPTKIDTQSRFFRIRAITKLLKVLCPMHDDQCCSNDGWTGAGELISRPEHHLGVVPEHLPRPSIHPPSRSPGHRIIMLKRLQLRFSLRPP